MISGYTIFPLILNMPHIYAPWFSFVHFDNLYLSLWIFVFSKSCLEKITLEVLLWSVENRKKIFVMKMQVHMHCRWVTPGEGNPCLWGSGSHGNQSIDGNYACCVVLFWCGENVRWITLRYPLYPEQFTHAPSVIPQQLPNSGSRTSMGIRIVLGSRAHFNDCQNIHKT